MLSANKFWGYFFGSWFRLWLRFSCYCGDCNKGENEAKMLLVVTAVVSVVLLMLILLTFDMTYSFPQHLK